MPKPMSGHTMVMIHGALRLTLDRGHVPQVAQPRALTDLLCPVLERRSYLQGANP